MKKIIKKIWENIRSNPKKFIFKVTLVLFVFWMLFDDYGILKRLRMEVEHRMLIDRQKIEQKKMMDNELRIRYALEPDSIEKASRERYNFRKPDETLFIIREK
ncbi:MAG: septum formation initiator family protein [Chlorobium sp.]|nr:septum formation initiator family protein [Chlorobium sp.]